MKLKFHIVIIIKRKLLLRSRLKSQRRRMILGMTLTINQIKETNTPTGAPTNPKNLDLNKNLNLVKIDY